MTNMSYFNRCKKKFEKTVLILEIFAQFLNIQGMKNIEKVCFRLQYLFFFFIQAFLCQTFLIVSHSLKSEMVKWHKVATAGYQE